MSGAACCVQRFHLGRKAPNEQVCRISLPDGPVPSPASRFSAGFKPYVKHCAFLRPCCAFRHHGLRRWEIT